MKEGVETGETKVVQSVQCLTLIHPIRVEMETIFISLDFSFLLTFPPPLAHPDDASRTRLAARPLAASPRRTTSGVQQTRYLEIAAVQPAPL